MAKVGVDKAVPFPFVPVSGGAARGPPRRAGFPAGASRLRRLGRAQGSVAEAKGTR